MSDENEFVRGVRMAVRGDATAFGYSILITATFAMANHRHPSITVGRIFLFALGATFAFAVVEAATSRFFRVRLREERSDVVIVGTAMAPVAVSLSLGGAYLSATHLGASSAWFFSPAVATVGYVVMTGTQLVVARRYADRHPPDSSSTG